MKLSIKYFFLATISLMFLAACAKPTQLQEGIDSFNKKNYKAAYSRLYPLALKGNSDAQYAVGYMLYYGKAGRVDKDAGIEWIRESASEGNPLAQQALGIIYAQANFAPEKRLY